MKRLGTKAEPTAEQLDKWSPDTLIDPLLAVRGKPITKVYIELLCISDMLHLLTYFDICLATQNLRA